MAQDDGKLIPSYEVHCPICEKPALGLGRTVAHAKRELRNYGWREHMSFGWCCETCSKRSARLAAPEEAYRLHEWEKSGVCASCGCLYVGFDRRDPCPGIRAALSSAEGTEG